MGPIFGTEWPLDVMHPVDTLGAYQMGVSSMADRIDRTSVIKTIHKILDCDDQTRVTRYGTEWQTSVYMLLERIGVEA